MRIAFVGKGGSGKTTCTSLFIQSLFKKNPLTVWAIDADLNMHLADQLGCQEQARSLQHISAPDAEIDIKRYLMGKNDRIKDISHFRKSTPPTAQSNFVVVSDRHNYILEHYAAKHDNIFLSIVGSYHTEGIGASCYHNNLAVLESLLSHTIDANGVVVVDMVAGVDAFAGTLHAQFDMIVFIVEPTKKSLEVYEQYKRLAEDAGIWDEVYVVGNKIGTQKDTAFIEAVIERTKLLGYLSNSQHVHEAEQGELGLDFSKLEKSNQHVFEAVYATLAQAQSSYNVKLQRLHALHKKYVSQASIRERFGDLTEQIDDTFNFDEYVQQYYGSTNKREHHQSGVFSGSEAVVDYLNPDNNPYIPLVELPEALNPLKADNVRIFAKLLNMLPLTNVKALPAYNMLLEAKERGDLAHVDTIIENSSGNTVASLAVIGRLMGIKATKAVVSNEVSPGKLQMLRLFGTEIIVNTEPICPDPSDTTSGIYKAKVWAAENGWWNAGQYDNPGNPTAHEKWTGKQIWEQMRDNISVFCAGLGTTGTMVGAGRYLKERKPAIRNVGVVRCANNPVPGPRTRNLLQEIAFGWENVVDSLEEVGTVDLYKASLELCRHGLVVGPSSGFALKGLYQYLERVKAEGKLDALRNEKGLVECVFICCDTPYPYLNEYFAYLDESEFPPIENQELLHPEGEGGKNITFDTLAQHEMTVEEAYTAIFSLKKEEVWQKVLDEQEVPIKENTVIVDIRNKEDFAHFHIPGAVHIEYEALERDTDHYLDMIQGKVTLVVCYRGNSSKRATSLLRRKNIEAYSISGGMTEWSRVNFPRWRAEVCAANMEIMASL